MLGEISCDALILMTFSSQAAIFSTLTSGGDNKFFINNNTSSWRLKLREPRQQPLFPSYAADSKGKIPRNKVRVHNNKKISNFS